MDERIDRLKSFMLGCPFDTILAGSHKCKKTDPCCRRAGFGAKMHIHDSVNYGLGGTPLLSENRVRDRIRERRL
jgi:hypothetical protein